MSHYSIKRELFLLVKARKLLWLMYRQRIKKKKKKFSFYGQSKNVDS